MKKQTQYEMSRRKETASEEEKYLCGGGSNPEESEDSEKEEQVLVHEIRQTTMRTKLRQRERVKRSWKQK